LALPSRSGWPGRASANNGNSRIEINLTRPPSQLTAPAAFAYVRTAVIGLCRKAMSVGTDDASTQQRSPEREQPTIGRRRLLAASILSVGAGVVAAGGSAVGLFKLLQGVRSGGAAGGGAAGGGAPVDSRLLGGTSPASASPSATATPTPTSTPPPTPTPRATVGAGTRAGFVHPGMLHTQADFDRIAAKVAAAAQPWRAGMDRLVGNGHSQSSWSARPLQTVIRGGSGQNYAQLYNDVHAAYQNALRWKITGDAAHGNAARDILNAWSATLTAVNGNADRFLAAGIYGYQFANVAELLRGYPGFDLGRFQTMLLTVFYPLCDRFLTLHNDACITNYWANWDLCNMAAILAIGILCDDRAKVNRAITYFKEGAGNGAIMKVVPFLHPGGLGQWQESGRDQGHATLGIGLLGTFCEMAWNQGEDLYGYADNRFLAGCEYVAKYNLGGSVPFTTYTWGTGQNCAQRSQTVVAEGARGLDRPIWELVYNHYAKRKGLSAPNTAAYAQRVRAEGGGGDYGPNSGGYDQLGFGTLMFTR
jgi:hypothetical protein